MSLKPKKAKIIKGKEAWWYDERGAISVYISGMGTTLSCRIKRSELVKFIKRSQPQKTP